MEYALKPFILVYHIVSSIINLPKRILSKTSDKVLEVQDQSELRKEDRQSLELSKQYREWPENVTQDDIAKQDSDNEMSASELLGNLPTRTQVKSARRPLVGYRYIIKNSVGRKEKGIISAETLQEARNFLQQQGYEVLNIQERTSVDIDINIGNNIKAKDLAFTLTQLSTYIKSGIPLVDSVKILAKQTTNKTLKRNFNQVVYELLKGESFSNALIAQGDFFPKLLINMVQTSELTGDLASILDDMAEYYTSMDNTRRQMKTAMTYPVVVLVLALGVLTFMLTYLVPQFSSLFESNGASLPPLTQNILNISNFVKGNLLALILGIVALIGGFIYLYKNVKSVRGTVQMILMHIPVVGDIIIYNEMANFTKTFASLLNHGVFITDCMDILSKITNNEIYKRIINKTLINLGKGENVSTAFKGEWAIPVVAYEMIVTGESTGQLGIMMDKVASHFQQLHKSLIDTLKSLVEPLLIIMLAIIVGIILVSIIQPMFQIYETIQW